MNRLLLWYLITISAHSLYASEKENYLDYESVPLTSILLPNSAHTIDLEYIEPLSNRPIKEFIQRAKDIDEPWLMALCHNEGSSCPYNAPDLMEWCRQSNRDPKTNTAIRDIEFFTVEHINEQIDINHVGTLHDLNNQSGLLRLLFLYTKSTSIEQKENAALLISHFYSETIRDLPSAIKWCQRAAKNNNINAIGELGYLCKENGDINGAFLYLTDAAEKGDVYAAINLGNLYSKNGDLNLASHWLTIGARQKIPEAMSQLGNVYYKLGKRAQAIKWLTEAALDNNPQTIADLAFVYRTQNKLSKALSFYLKAAKLGLPTLDLFYTLHLAVGYPAHENAQILEKYADLLIDKINKKDQSINAFKQESPDRYLTALDIINRYAIASVIPLE